MGTKRLVAAAAVGSAFAFTGAVFASADSGGGTNASASAHATGVVATEGIGERFSVLSRPQRAADGLPPAALDGSAIEQTGPVRLAARAEAGTLYASAGSGEVCTTLVDETGTSGGCVSEQLANQGGTVGTTLTVDGVIVAGLVPDGVEAVTVVSEGGATATARVDSNGFVVKVGGAPATLRYRDGDGERVVPIPFMPAEGEVVEAR